MRFTLVRRPTAVMSSASKGEVIFQGSILFPLSACPHLLLPLLNSISSSLPPSLPNSELLLAVSQWVISSWGGLLIQMVLTFAFILDEPHWHTTRGHKNKHCWTSFWCRILVSNICDNQCGHTLHWDELNIYANTMKMSAILLSLSCSLP